VVDVASHRARHGDQCIELTPTEFKLLAVLSRHSGRTLTHNQLLSHAWGDAVQRDARLVAKHLSALRRKLDGHGPTQITTVHGVGYRLENGR
jgi:DNA-binding response OmpR family regulator